MAPVITTKRFYLQQFSPTDAGTMFRLNSDPEVMRYTGDVPFTSVAEAAAFLENYSAYKNFGYGRWMIFSNIDNEPYGWCGLKLDPEINQVDLGFRLFRKYWNNGVATETGKACLDYAFNNLKLSRVVGRAHSDNKASIRVLQKLGMQYEEDFIWRGQNWVKYVAER